MADKIEVTSPVAVESDSKERVAFDLACKIAEHTDIEFRQKDKKYWLTLYRQCWKATTGHALPSILAEE